MDIRWKKAAASRTTAEVHLLKSTVCNPKRHARILAHPLWTVFLMVSFPWLSEVAIVAAPGETTTDSATSKTESIPPPLTEYKGRRIARTMSYRGAPWLIRATREKEESCSELLKALHLQPGQVACDIGCGNGFYTLKLAKLVGEKGRVMAVDIQPEMLSLLKERAKSENVTNIKPVLSTVIDPGLAEASVDLILLVDVYHEFSHPERMLQALRKSLKPKGRIALVEYREEDPLVPIKPLHKMSKKQMLKEFLPNGFRLVEQYDALPWQHVMFFSVDDHAK